MIYTWSKFNYGHTVTSENNVISCKEGAGALKKASIEVGSYTTESFAVAVKTALQSVGSLVYQVTIDRATQQLSISAPTAFSLLIQSGGVTNSAFPLMGFSYSTDLLNKTSVTGNQQTGSSYFPQFLLQSYVAPENFVENVDPTINQSADGRVEMVSFGTRQKVEMDIKFITNLPMDGVVIKNNPSGLQQAREFLSYISQKRPIEFVPDIEAPSVFHKLILEKSPDFGSGTCFKLRELYDQGLCDVFETGLLQFRVID